MNHISLSRFVHLTSLALIPAMPTLLGTWSPFQDLHNEPLHVQMTTTRITPCVDTGLPATATSSQADRSHR